MNKKVIIATAAFILLVIVVFAGKLAREIANRAFGPKATVEVAGKIFKVDIADGPTERLIGLSGRKSLKEDSGMLFIFDKKLIIPFWMKGMRFPIDMVWIEDDVVIGMQKNIPVEEKAVGENIRYYPPSAIDKVLEINAGISDKIGIAVGDKVIINVPKK